MRKIFMCFLAGLMCMTSLVGCAAPQQEATKRAEYPDNVHVEVPRDYTQERGENKGMTEFVEYETKDYRGNGESFKKQAMVYLPHGYDQEDTETKYNVLYMMHGGGGNEYEALQSDNFQLVKILDHMFENGDAEPCIVVGISYNNPHNGDATACCQNFVEEFLNDLCPAIELKYNTYLTGDSHKAIKSSRTHRAFGGFSMGAACTWWMFEQALDSIAYFLPVSGNCWAGDGVHMTEAVESFGLTKDDFLVYTAVGGWRPNSKGEYEGDMATPNCDGMVADFKANASDMFVFCDNFKDGNIYYADYKNYWHYQYTVHMAVYDALPKFFVY